jgi:hypothetical protein
VDQKSKGKNLKNIPSLTTFFTALKSSKNFTQIIPNYSNFPLAKYTQTLIIIEHFIILFFARRFFPRSDSYESQTQLNSTVEVSDEFILDFLSNLLMLMSATRLRFKVNRLKTCWMVVVRSLVLENKNRERKSNKLIST